MAKKLQSFVIMKFESSRLKSENYNLSLTLDEARSNQEVVRVGDSQLLKIVREVTGKEFSREKLKDMIMNKRFAEKNKDHNAALILMKLIDEMLFIDSIVEIKFDNKKHYQHMIEQGLKINGFSYVRLLAGSGNLRRNVVFFIKEELFSKVISILNNGRDETIKFNPAKFGAYMGLYNSSGYNVTFPKLCVVDDYLFKMMVKMDWINDDNTISNDKDTEVEVNAFDGQGIISVELAEQWSRDLELDYIPSSFVFRSPFAKGQVVTFDIQAFAELSQTYNIVDIWGNVVDCRDCNLFISKSQLKLWPAYQSCNQYVAQCYLNNLGFWVSKYSSKTLKNHAYTNYMFLQVLDLSDKDIEEFCNPTLEYFNSLMGADRNKMLIYSYPTVKDSLALDNIDPTNLALMFNEDFANEPHIREKYRNSLKKKFKESYLGNILVQGNFQSIIADPYAQCEHILGLDVYGLLKSDEHYCDYWNKKSVNQVASARSPLTHQSEMNLSKLTNRKSQEDWYRYITNGFIISPKGIDTFLWADSDEDGDLVFTTDNKFLINGRQPGNPISYAKRSAQKVVINLNELWKTDMLAFNSKVGFITNVTSTYHCMLSDFEKGSEEYIEIQSRLKILRLIQGEIIDSAKSGGLVKTIPDHWTKKIKKDDPDFTDEEKEFYNKIVAIKRPKFMRHLYSHYGKNFNNSVERRNRKLLEMGELQNDRLYDFIENNSVMNRIEKYMTKEIEKIKEISKSEKYFPYHILLTPLISLAPEKEFDLCKKIISQYRSLKKSSFKKGIHLDILKDFSIQIKKFIIESGKSVDDIFDSLVIYLYEENTLKTDILWDCFGDIIVERVKKDKFVFIPVENVDGEIDYLGKKYSIQKVILDE